jgi:hypothetical protein
MNAALPPMHAGIDAPISSLQVLPAGCVGNIERIPG